MMSMLQLIWHVSVSDVAQKEAYEDINVKRTMLGVAFLTIRTFSQHRSAHGTVLMHKQSPRLNAVSMRCFIEFIREYHSPIMESHGLPKFYRPDKFSKRGM